MFRLSEAAAYLRISPATLRRWDATHKLPAHRTLGGHRRYTQTQLEQFGPPPELPDPPVTPASERIPYLYARVSTDKQLRDGNLARQAARLEHAVKQRFGTHVRYELIQEYGSGLNPHRKGIRRLIDAVIHRKVSVVIIEYTDRLTRFGGPYLTTLFQVFDTPLLALEHKTEAPLETQLLEDMMMLIASFSGKFYHARTAARRAAGNPEQSKIDRWITRIITRTIAC